MFRLRRVAAVAVLALPLCACTAPQADAGRTPTSPETPAAAAPAPDPQTRRPVGPPRMSDPLPPQRVREQPVVVDRSCRTDADCAVKDVGNCCGYYPACVNKDSPTDPAAVRAQCQRQGMASVCGFREISACICNAGQCQAADGDAPVAQ